MVPPQGFALTQLMHPRAGVLGSEPWLIVTKTDEAAERLFEDLRFYHGLQGVPVTSLALFPSVGNPPLRIDRPLTLA